MMVCGNSNFITIISRLLAEKDVCFGKIMFLPQFLVARPYSSGTLEKKLFFKVIIHSSSLCLLIFLVARRDSRKLKIFFLKHQIKSIS